MTEGQCQYWKTPGGRYPDGCNRPKYELEGTVDCNGHIRKECDTSVLSKDLPPVFRNDEEMAVVREIIPTPKPYEKSPK